MADLTAPEVNGRAYDFSSVIFECADVKLTSFTKVAYSDNVERGELRGNRPYIIARTRGKYSAEGSCEMSRAQFEALIAKLGDGLYDKVFAGTVSYADTGAPTIVDKLVGVRLKKIGADNSEGGDPLMISLDLDVDMVKWNGKEPFEARVA